MSRARLLVRGCVLFWSVAACESTIELRSKRDGQAEASLEDRALDATGDAADAIDATSDAADVVDAADATLAADAAGDRTEDDGSAPTEAGAGCASTLDCPSGQSCVAGRCVASCVPSVEVCNGLDDDCDGAIDESDAMSALCAAGATCASGRCTPAGGCGAGQTACGGACVDLSTNASHCGACGVRCAAGLRCVAGACVP